MAEQVGPGWPRYGAVDDRVLLRRMAGGDQEAVAGLYDRYAPRIYGLALRICRDPGSAEEVVQDVFLTAWREAPRYDPARGSVATWLFAFARNRAIDVLRRRARRPELLPDEVGGRQLPGEGDVLAAAEDRLLAAAARRALDRLPPIYREPIQLAYFQGLTQREIAQALGVPLGTVKTRIRVAIEHLRQVLVAGDPAEEGHHG